MDTLQRITAFNFIEYEGYIYLSNRFYNGLFKVEINSGETTFLGNFKDEKLCEKNIHIEVFLGEQKIYFCPKRGRNVHIYNLEERSMETIEIRKKTEDFFLVRDVILDEGFLFFIPLQNGVSIRRLDLDSLEIVEMDQKTKVLGSKLSESRKEFPFHELIEKYQIDSIDNFFWKRIYDNCWYGFLPTGCQLLKYTEGTNEIEMIPLTVTNKTVLEEHLQKVGKSLLAERFIPESRLDIPEFVRLLKRAEAFRHDSFEDNGNVGEKVWELLRNGS